ncbi:MAG: aromatic amino acid lyase [Alphaproteobacteria bacterium]
MTVTLNTLADLSLANARRVAIDGQSIAIGQTARAAMDRARAAYEAMLAAEPDLFIYGTTTGPGMMAKDRVTPEERQSFAEAFRRWQPRGHGFGDAVLPERLCRLMVLARLANFIAGHGAVRPLVAERVAAVLDKPLPPVPLRGMTGPGEILPLFHLFADLPDDDWLPGEPMSLLNGSPCASATVADVALSARARLGQAVRAFALAIEAQSAPLGHYEAAVGRLWNNPYDAEACAALMDALAGVASGNRQAYQAPVSWRVMPRVLGQAFRVVANLEEVAAQSLAAVSANPVYLFPGESGDEGPSGHGRSVSTGGYHNGQAHPAIDAVNAAFAEVVTLMGHVTGQLQDGRVTRLADGLSPGGRFPHGTMNISWLLADYVDRARLMATPTLIPASAYGAMVQTDVSEPVFAAWEKHQAAAECLDMATTVMTAITVHALDLGGTAPPPKLAAMAGRIRDLALPLVAEDGIAAGAGLDRVYRRMTDAALRGDPATFETAN